MNVINVTDQAIKEIEAIFANDVSAKGKALRIKVVGGGCSGLNYKMEFDEIQDNDFKQVFSSFTLAVDPKSSIYLKGTTLDYSSGLEGKGFKFINPNATNTCGCGESFSV